MRTRKGFTLIEIIIVLVIVGIGAKLVLPNLIIAIEQTKAQSARNNLLAIAAAEQRYSEDNDGAYCTNAGGSPTCGGTTASLNSGLRLGVSTSDSFTYSCSTTTAPYRCTAADGTDTLTLSVDAATLATTVTCASASNSNCPS